MLRPPLPAQGRLAAYALRTDDLEAQRSRLDPTGGPDGWLPAWDGSDAHWPASGIVASSAEPWRPILVQPAAAAAAESRPLPDWQLADLALGVTDLRMASELLLAVTPESQIALSIRKQPVAAILELLLEGPLGTIRLS